MLDGTEIFLHIDIDFLSGCIEEEEIIEAYEPYERVRQKILRLFVLTNFMTNVK